MLYNINKTSKFKVSKPFVRAIGLNGCTKFKVSKPFVRASFLRVISLFYSDKILGPRRVSPETLIILFFAIFFYGYSEWDDHILALEELRQIEEFIEKMKVDPLTDDERKWIIKEISETYETDIQEVILVAAIVGSAVAFVYRLLEVFVWPKLTYEI